MTTSSFACVKEVKPVSYEATATLTKPDGSAMVMIDRLTHDGSLVGFSTGWCANETEAEEMAAHILNLGDKDIMNLLKNDKLFPHIKAVMLKDKRVTLHLSGKVEIITVEARTRDSDESYKSELYFTDRNKTAMLNENQTLVIVGIYGGETNEWKGKPVVLYGEHGKWFGKKQWALRVDEQATEEAYRQWKLNKAFVDEPKKESPDHEIEEALVDNVIDNPDSAAARFEEERELELEQLAEELPFDLPDESTANNYTEA